MLAVEKYITGRYMMFNEFKKETGITIDFDIATADILYEGITPSGVPGDKVAYDKNYRMLERVDNIIVRVPVQDDKGVSAVVIVICTLLEDESVTNKVITRVIGSYFIKKYFIKDGGVIYGRQTKVCIENDIKGFKRF